MALPLAGYNTAGTINNVAIALTEWEVTPEVDDMDATNTESLGFHVAFPGPVKAEVTITGFYDATLNPFTDFGATGLTAGAYVSLEIFVNANPTVGAEPAWIFATSPGTLNGAMVKSCQVKGNVKEKVMFTAHLVGSGVFSYPAGDVI